MKKRPGRLFCTLADIEKAIESGLGKQGKQALVFMDAIKVGYNEPV
jgi:hypothetical protein